MQIKKNFKTKTLKEIEMLPDDNDDIVRMSNCSLLTNSLINILNMIEIRENCGLLINLLSFGEPKSEWDDVNSAAEAASILYHLSDNMFDIECVMEDFEEVGCTFSFEEKMNGTKGIIHTPKGDIEFS
jgi:hypothetical protein